MSEKKQSFVEGCIEDAKFILKSGVEGAKKGYDIAGPAGAAAGFLVGVRAADKYLDVKTVSAIEKKNNESK